MGPGRRVRSEARWAQARDAYLAGEGAAEVCERFDLGLTALRDRAKREGWRRRDRPDPEPSPEAAADVELDPDDLDPGTLAAEVMMERAWRMAARALGRGRLREAQGWTRLVSDLKAAGDTRRAAAVAANQNPQHLAVLEASLAKVDEARRAARPRARAASLDSPDSPRDPDSSASIRGPDSANCQDSLRAPSAGTAAPATRDPPFLNRADRRRLARLGAARPRDGP